MTATVNQDHPVDDVSQSATIPLHLFCSLATKWIRFVEQHFPGATPMTEAEWLACTEPTPMLEFLRGKASDRKLRLFACACCRRFWHLIEDERSRKAVEVSERYADGLATRQEVASARGQLKADYRNKHRAAIVKAVSEQAAFGWAFGWDMVQDTLRAKSSDVARLEVHGFAAACHTGLVSDGRQGYYPTVLLHDLFGPLPFRSVTLDPAWLAWQGGTVPKLTQAIYQERAFDRLPILADALEEAGCHDPDILAHCRQTGPHVRGCWVVDLLLGKG
jgi:hypothetical protein